MLPNLPYRTCECGCGVTFQPKRNGTKYATETCRTRAYRARHRPQWNDRLSQGNRDIFNFLIKSTDELERKAARVIQMEGESFGHVAAARMLNIMLFIIIKNDNLYSYQVIRNVYNEDVVETVLQ